MTSAPASANDFAICFPIPPEDPVTRAVLPFNENCFSMFSVDELIMDDTEEIDVREAK